jgi:hypothetical protein
VHQDHSGSLFSRRQEKRNDGGTLSEMNFAHTAKVSLKHVVDHFMGRTLIVTLFICSLFNDDFSVNRTIYRRMIG